MFRNFEILYMNGLTRFCITPDGFDSSELNKEYTDLIAKKPIVDCYFKDNKIVVRLVDEKYNTLMKLKPYDNNQKGNQYETLLYEQVVSSGLTKFCRLLSDIEMEQLMKYKEAIYDTL